LKSRYFPALLSAFLLWLGWPPFSYTSPLLLVAFVPLLFALEHRASGTPVTGGQVFRISFLCFFIWNTASVYWVYHSLASAMDWWVALLVSVIPFSLAPLLMALAIRLYVSLRRQVKPLTAYAGLVCFWIGYEYLNQCWDLAFPWMTLGNGFAATPVLVQWYACTGVFGGSLWILLSNILVFETCKNRKLWPVAVLVIVLPALVSVATYVIYKEKPDPAKVVVVQPNIDPYAKFGSMSSQQQIGQLTRLSDSLGKKNTEFFIWPETAIPAQADESRIRVNPDFLQAQQFLLPYKNGSLISGIESLALYDSAQTVTAVFHPGIGRYADVFNAGILIENSARVQFYHKSKLVPGVEKTPFSRALSWMNPLFAQFGGTTGGYGGQDEPSVLYAQSGVGVAPVICFDSIWGDWVAGAVKKGAQFIAVMTNDGWWGNTSGKDQHFDYARLRAVETRRWVARSANTGISGFINQRGDVVSRSSWWTPTALEADINLNEELTFYVKYGDVIALAACFGCACFLLTLVFMRVKSTRRIKRLSSS
jgi:apolipoprotein N-acyltransferase